MKELWEKRGYARLGLTSQNLRYQGARLEKTMPMGNLSKNTNDNEDTRLEEDIPNSKLKFVASKHWLILMNIWVPQT